MTHLSEEDLILLHYRDPEASLQAQAHLTECQRCRAEADSLARSLSLCDEWTVPPAPPELERSIWAQLAPQLHEPARTSRRRLLLSLGFAALLVAAFVLGRVTTRAPRPVLIAGLSPDARERILHISLADHLDRAGMLLTEISNVSEVDATERDRAQDLVDEGRLMRQVLISHDEDGTLALIDEVERFMLEVANSSSSSSSASHLRERISSGSLLFKVRIIESNLRREGKTS